MRVREARVLGAVSTTYQVTYRYYFLEFRYCCRHIPGMYLTIMLSDMSVKNTCTWSSSCWRALLFPCPPASPPVFALRDLPGMPPLAGLGAGMVLSQVLSFISVGEYKSSISCLALAYIRVYTLTVVSLSFLATRFR